VLPELLLAWPLEVVPVPVPVLVEPLERPAVEPVVVPPSPDLPVEGVPQLQAGPKLRPTAAIQPSVLRAGRFIQTS
jgi:hypothetical protein